MKFLTKKRANLNTVELNNSSVEANPIQTEITQPYPEYLINNSEVVGYPTTQFQEYVYRISSQNVFNSDIKSVLDIGCGRGDFGSYLKKVVNPDIEYTGIDLNQLHIEVGTQKFSSLENFKLICSNVLDFSHTADICVLNSIFDSNYDNHSNNSYDYFKQILTKSLDISNLGVVIIAINDRFKNEVYNTFNMSEIVQIITDFELKFSLENIYEYPTLFKLMIEKQTF